MDETQWDIEEVKRLKRKQLLQFNLVMLVLFLLLFNFFKSEGPFFLFAVCYVLMVIQFAIILYNLKTGRFVGTKTSIRVQQFDRERLGKKRWKRKKIIETVFLIAVGIFITVFIVKMDFPSAGENYTGSTFLFIGAWIGYNIGELFRMSKLEV